MRGVLLFFTPHLRCALDERPAGKPRAPARHTAASLIVMVTFSLVLAISTEGSFDDALKEKRKCQHHAIITPH